MKSPLFRGLFPFKPFKIKVALNRVDGAGIPAGEDPPDGTARNPLKFVNIR